MTLDHAFVESQAKSDSLESQQVQGPADLVLSVRDLAVDIVGDDAQKNLIDRVSFDLYAGQTLALIGESGCGKTMTAMGILGLLPSGARVSAGQILLNGVDLLTLSAHQLRRIRGGVIGTVFQDPMASLNPTMTVGDQIAESRILHLGESRKEARVAALSLLDNVGIPNAKARLDAYPHQLSGGMQQRVMIAMAIACGPKLLVADEPTTALDVTIQADVLDLLDQLKTESQMAILLVTHDLGVVAGHADDTVVMYAGQAAERAPTSSIFDRPLHPYTSALMRAIPQKGSVRQPLAVIPGRVPSAGSFPVGCRFFSRCDQAVAGVCDQPGVGERHVNPGHTSRCVRAEELSLFATTDKESRYAAK